MDDTKIVKASQRLPETPAPVLEAEIIDTKPDLSKPVLAPWTTVLARAVPTNANETELRDCPPEFMVELKVPTQWLAQAKKNATPPKHDPYSGVWKAYERNRKKQWTIKVTFGGGDINLELEHRAT